jgi:putative ABC transport system permease protein
MYYLKLFVQFYQDMRQQKLRTFLTIFGICWGTVAVVLLMAFGVGLERRIMRSQHGMGQGIGIVWPQRTTLPFEGLGTGRPIQFREEDADLLKRKIPEITLVSPEFIHWGARISYGRTDRRATVSGVHPEFGEMRNLIPEPGGRFINQMDLELSRRSIFIGNKLRDNLFGKGSNAVGRIVTVNGEPFTVVGVLLEKIQNSDYSGRDNSNASIAASTYRAFFGGLYAEDIIYQVADPSMSREALQAVYRVLGQRFKFDPQDINALSIWDTNDADLFFKYFFLGFDAFLGIGGLFTLLVGGIGVANIMYVVVRERRREVGIKMALGATPRTILLQFMAETLLIVTFGGASGFGLSYGVIQIFHLPALANLTEYLGFPVINLPVALGTVAVLGAVGFAAGYAPARRASRMNPVTALEF